MDIPLTFWCVLLLLLLTIPLSHFASASPSIISSIPLYHRGMRGVHYYPHMKATTDIYPKDDAYAIFLWIGTPVQIVFVTVDTGSPISWFQCDPCNSCYPMQRPPFNTRASSTLKELACYSDTCLIPMMREVLGNCTGWTCRYSAKYGNESLFA